MRRSNKGPARGPAPKVQPINRRVIQVTLEDEGVELLDDLCQVLGVDAEEAFIRGLSLLSAELAKAAILMPAYLDDDLEDDEDDDED